MTKGTRYDASGYDEAQFEPGSRKRVLKNLRGIKSRREMDRLEAREQLRALSHLYRAYDRNYRFTAADACRLHKVWLGSVYEWAGQYRHVNLKKNDFPFAAAEHIPRLMLEFEQGPLRAHTPCNFRSPERVVEALAVVMALQAGLPLLDFGGIRGRIRREYFAAVQAGLDRSYEPMKQVFSGVVRRTLRIHAKPSF